MTTTNFISVHKYAKKNETSLQNVYRWIREGKFAETDIKIEEILVKRIRIKPEAIIKINQN